MQLLQVNDTEGTRESKTSTHKVYKDRNQPNPKKHTTDRSTEKADTLTYKFKSSLGKKKEIETIYM